MAEDLQLCGGRPGSPGEGAVRRPRVLLSLLVPPGRPSASIRPAEPASHQVPKLASRMRGPSPSQIDPGGRWPAACGGRQVSHIKGPRIVLGGRRAMAEDLQLCGGRQVSHGKGPANCGGRPGSPGEGAVRRPSGVAKLSGISGEAFGLHSPGRAGLPPGAQANQVGLPPYRSRQLSTGA